VGDFAGGWSDYEHRFAIYDTRRRLPQPRWDGSPLEGRTILLHAEQGQGDTIQFIRYATLVRGGAVIVECQKPLVELVKSCPGVDRVIAAGERLPAFDVESPLPSLPGIFKTELATIPRDIPYLSPPAEHVAAWSKPLGDIAGFKVGIAWAGNPAQMRDHWRSIALKEFAPLAAIPGVRLLSLQVGHGREQIDGAFPLIDLANWLTDFTATAAVIRNLDLVIACDSSVAHLAGALGARTWVALTQAADWRWLEGRSDSPWYPTARLYRQEREHDWQSVFESVAGDLRELTHGED
jgi:hypothetical protein